MMDETVKCFRCGAQPKILMNLKIDDREIKMCPRCEYDFCLFLEGHAIDNLVCVQRDRYVRKEEKE